MAIHKYESTTSHLRKQLHELGHQQGEVTEARAQVLVKRDTVDQTFQSIRSQRDLVVDAEAQLMDALREKVHAQDSKTTRNPFLLHGAVDQERSKLVQLEDGLSSLLRELDAAEWELSDLENDLYQFNLQELLPEGSETSSVGSEKYAYSSESHGSKLRNVVSTREYENAVAEQRRLGSALQKQRGQHSYSKSYRSLVYQPESTTSLDAGEESNELIELIMKSEVKVQSLRHQLVFSSTDIGLDLFLGETACSEPIYKSSCEPPVLHWGRHSDTSVQDWTSPTNEVMLVQNWLLDRLRNSDSEKDRYMNILQDHMRFMETMRPIFRLWEQDVILYWLHDGTSALTSTEEDPYRDDQNRVYDTAESETNQVHLRTQDLQGIGDCFELEYSDRSSRILRLGVQVHESTAKAEEQSQPMTPDHALLHATETTIFSNVRPHLTLTGVNGRTDTIAQVPPITSPLAVDTCIKDRHDSAHNSEASLQAMKDTTSDYLLESSDRISKDKLHTSANTQVGSGTEANHHPRLEGKSNDRILHDNGIEVSNSVDGQSQGSQNLEPYSSRKNIQATIDRHKIEAQDLHVR